MRNCSYELAHEICPEQPRCSAAAVRQQPVEPHMYTPVNHTYTSEPSTQCDQQSNTVSVLGFSGSLTVRWLPHHISQPTTVQFNVSCFTSQMNRLLCDLVLQDRQHTAQFHLSALQIPDYDGGVYCIVTASQGRYLRICRSGATPCIWANHCTTARWPWLHA